MDLIHWFDFWGAAHTKSWTRQTIEQFFPESGLANLPAQIARDAEQQAREFNLGRALWEKIEEASHRRGIHSSRTRSLFQDIVQAPEGMSLEAHLQQALENPSRIGKALTKLVEKDKREKEKSYRESRTIPTEELEQLSRIFGGLEFTQNPLSLRVFAKINSADDDAAKAIAGILNTAIQEKIFYPSAREKKQPKPSSENLFCAFSSSKNTIGADLFLELKPQWAQVIIKTFSERKDYLLNVATSSLHDCYDLVFNYGRKQTELMGGKPLGLRFEDRLIKQNSGFLFR